MFILNPIPPKPAPKPDLSTSQTTVIPSTPGPTTTPPFGGGTTPPSGSAPTGPIPHVPTTPPSGSTTPPRGGNTALVPPTPGSTGPILPAGPTFRAGRSRRRRGGHRPAGPHVELRDGQQDRGGDTLRGPSGGLQRRNNYCGPEALGQHRLGICLLLGPQRETQAQVPGPALVRCRQEARRRRAGIDRGEAASTRRARGMADSQ